MHNYFRIITKTLSQQCGIIAQLQLSSETGDISKSYGNLSQDLGYATGNNNT
jgi:hypothetical protein